MLSSAQLSSVSKHQSRYSAGIHIIAQLKGTVSQPSAQEMVMDSRANELQQLCASPSISRWPQLLSCGLSACPGHTGSSVSETSIKRFSENTARAVPPPERDEDSQLPKQKMLPDFLVFI